MRAERIIATVPNNGILELDLTEFSQQQVEIIIIPIDLKPNSKPETVHLMQMQEKSGFVQAVLAHAAEDVWNDL